MNDYIKISRRLVEIGNDWFDRMPVLHSLGWYGDCWSRLTLWG